MDFKNGTAGQIIYKYCAVFYFLAFWKPLLQGLGQESEGKQASG
jgi:hypothetical protein